MPATVLLRSLLFLCACLPIALVAQQRGLGALVPEPGSPIPLTVETNFTLPKGYKLPPTVDLSKHFPPPGDQHRQNSCTTWALCYNLMSYRKNRLAGRTYSPTDTLDAAHSFSPAYLYDRMVAVNDQPCTTSLDFPTLAEQANANGCVLWSTLPYDTAITGCMQRLEARMKADALRHRPPPMVELNAYNVEQWQYHLAEGRPIVATVVIDSSFVFDAARGNGQVPFTWNMDNWRSNHNGHAVVCVGYNADSTFTFVNSYGQRWGLHGYFKATWEVLEYKCYGAYTMYNDTVVDWSATPGRPADRDLLNGALVKESFEPGEYQEINGLKVGLVHLHEDRNRAVVSFFDAASDSLLQTMTVRSGQDHTFYHEGRSITFTYRDRKGIPRLFTKKLPMQLAETPSITDSYVNERNTRLERLREELR